MDASSDVIAAIGARRPLRGPIRSIVSQCGFESALVKAWPPGQAAWREERRHAPVWLIRVNEEYLEMFATTASATVRPIVFCSFQEGDKGTKIKKNEGGPA